MQTNNINILTSHYPGLSRFMQKKQKIESSNLSLNKIKSKFGFKPLTVPDSKGNGFVIVPNSYINRHGIILTVNPNGEYKVRDYTIDKDLYNRLGISVFGRQHMYFMHRLVAFNFLDNPQQYDEVNHIDRDITNCDVSNLEWCSAEQNREHAMMTNELRITLPDGAVEQIYVGQNGVENIVRVYRSIKDIPTTLSTCGTRIARNYVRKCCLNNLITSKTHSYHGYIWKFKNINIS